MLAKYAKLRRKSILYSGTLFSIFPDPQFQFHIDDTIGDNNSLYCDVYATNKMGSSSDDWIY
jgi:hypothetical protein